jgi:hypothetical protein
MSLDLAASSLRADSTDVGQFVETLAVKLERALPAATSVRRRSRRAFSRDKRVERIEVTVGDLADVLDASAARPECRRVKLVRGIAIKSEPLDPTAWVQALVSDLAAEAAQSDAARRALEELLG